MAYAEQLKNSLFVGIHMRRGDFVTLSWNIPLYYYKNTYQQILDMYLNMVFFDDIEWCKQNVIEMGFDMAKTIKFYIREINRNNKEICKHVDIYI